MSTEIKYLTPTDTPIGPFMRFKYVAVIATPYQASLTTSLAGANNDLVFTAVDGGTAGNQIYISYTDPGAVSQSISVSVTSTPSSGSTTKHVIDFSLDTDGAGAITTTADDIKVALAGDATAAALVTAADSGGDDGSGEVIAMSESALTSGADNLVMDMSLIAF